MAARGRFGGWVSLLVAAILALAMPHAALAHAALVSSTPADGATLEDPPSRLGLTFNEAVAVTSLRLVGPDGRVQALEPARADGVSVEIAPPGPLARGSYILSFRVVSEDGHPVGGAVAFSVGEPAGARPEAAPSTADPALRAVILASRVALYAGLLFGVGGAFARAWLSDGRADGSGAVALVIAAGLLAAPLAFALQGVDLRAATLVAVLEADVWREASRTSFAWSVGFAVAAFVAALASLRLGEKPARAAAALGLVLLGLSFAASGHASAASPQWLMRPAVFVHVVPAAFWMGALVRLVRLPVRGFEPSMETLRRFSAAAPVAVGALFASGVAIAVVQVEKVEALWTTDYGLVLTTKLALVAALLALAAANRWAWTGATLAGDARAAARLRRSVLAELVIGACVIGVVGLWRFTPPPRAVMAQDIQIVTELRSRTVRAEVTASPRSGLTVRLTRPDGAPLAAKEVTVVAWRPADRVEPIRRPADRSQDGFWRVRGSAPPMAAGWRIRIEALVTDFDVERLEGEVGRPPQRP